MKTSFYFRIGAYDQTAGAEKPLFINNFGFYRAITSNISVSRPNGREDYHLLYVANGELSIDGKRLCAGDSFIFVPGEPQIYTYKAGDDVLYYWVHFTGSDIEKMLGDGEIERGLRRSNRRRQETETLLRLMYDLMTRGIDQNSACMLSLLRALMELLAEKPLCVSPFDRAIKMLEGDGMSVGEIAKSYGMTPEHFIRSFRAAHGVTPQKYRNEYRLCEARTLLCDTDMPVGEIAAICSFSDPLYFSRVFKARFGRSPAAYRKEFSK